MESIFKLFQYRDPNGFYWDRRKLPHVVGVYEGEISNNKPHGKGKLNLINKGDFVGEWDNGKRNGEGIYKETYLTIKGIWKDDRAWETIAYDIFGRVIVQVIEGKHGGLLKELGNKKLEREKLFAGAEFQIVTTALQYCPDSVPKDVTKKVKKILEDNKK